MAKLISMMRSVTLIGLLFGMVLCDIDELDDIGDMDFGDMDFGDMDFGGMGDYYGGMGGYGGYGGYGDYGGYGGYDSGPSYTELSDEADLEAFLSDEDQVGSAKVVGFFLEENEEDIEQFQALSSDLKYEGDYKFAYTTEADLLQARKYKGSAVLVYHAPRHTSAKYEKPRKRFPGKSLQDLESVKKFVHKAATPLVGELTWSNMAVYTDALGLPVLTLFAAVDHAKNEKGYTYFANRLRRVAQDYKGKLSFNIADKEMFSHLAKEHGEDAMDLEGKNAVGVGIKKGKMVYTMEGEFSTDALRAFVEAFVAGTLQGKEVVEPDYSSYGEEEEEDYDDGDSAVIESTPETFEADALAAGTAALVEFYAPWCGHCKQLKPEYRRLAAAFEGDAAVNVVAYDASSHGAPEGFDVQGFPTLVFLPADDKSTPEPYEGPRTAEAMEEFIRDRIGGGAKAEL